MTSSVGNVEPKRDLIWFETIKVGQRVDLQLLDQKNTRFSSEIIGFKPGKYLLLKPDDSISERLLLSGLTVVSRCLVEDPVAACLAFKSELLHLIRLPERLLALSFPSNVQRYDLRRVKRIQTKIQANIKIDTDTSGLDYTGAVVDASSKGCRFVFDDETLVDSKVNLVSVCLTVAMPDGSAFTLSGEIRNSRKEKSRLCVGILFTQEDTRLVQLAQGEAA